MGAVALSNAQNANVFGQTVLYRVLELVIGLASEFDTKLRFVLEAHANAVNKTLSNLAAGPDIAEL